MNGIATSVINIDFEISDGSHSYKFRQQEKHIGALDLWLFITLIFHILYSYSYHNILGDSQ
jgi:hypothetical protein